jgi:hypothetical protein
MAWAGAKRKRWPLIGIGGALPVLAGQRGKAVGRRMGQVPSWL